MAVTGLSALPSKILTALNRCAVNMNPTWPLLSCDCGLLANDLTQATVGAVRLRHLGLRQARRCLLARFQTSDNMAAPGGRVPPKQRQTCSHVSRTFIGSRNFCGRFSRGEDSMRYYLAAQPSNILAVSYLFLFSPPRFFLCLASCGFPSKRPISSSVDVGASVLAI